MRRTRDPQGKMFWTRSRELVRSYFSVDFVEGEDGQRGMVVMTHPNFWRFCSSPLSSLVGSGTSSCRLTSLLRSTHCCVDGGRQTRRRAARGRCEPRVSKPRMTTSAILILFTDAVRFHSLRRVAAATGTESRTTPPSSPSRCCTNIAPTWCSDIRSSPTP